MVLQKNTLHIIVLSLLVLSCTLIGCDKFDKKRHSGVVAEYNGKTITAEEIQTITVGLTGEDSTRVAEKYIFQWATELIEYDIAKDRSSKELEKLVEDYRRALYLHEYEKRLISQRMPKAIEDTLIASFYAQHQEEFVLRETILQGVLLVVPNGAPNIEELRKRVKDPSNEENLEWVEKFAYQYAVGYELFLDNWKTSTQIYLRMPFETNDLTKQLKRANQIFMQDSTHTYLLQATNMHFEGAAMPMDYARPEIEKIILNERQVGFLQRERQALYEKAIRDKQLKRYEE